MKLPASRKEKLLWYLIIPFISVAILGIFLYMTGFLKGDLLSLIFWIIISSIAIGQIGLCCDELIKTMKRYMFGAFSSTKYSRYKNIALGLIQAGVLGAVIASMILGSELKLEPHFSIVITCIVLVFGETVFFVFVTQNLEKQLVTSEKNPLEKKLKLQHLPILWTCFAVISSLFLFFFYNKFFLETFVLFYLGFLVMLNLSFLVVNPLFQKLEKQV